MHVAIVAIVYKIIGKIQHFVMAEDYAQCAST